MKNKSFKKIQYWWWLAEAYVCSL